MKTETRVIGDSEYEVTQLGFAAQRATFVKLCNFAGPAGVSLLKELISKTAKSKTKQDAMAAFAKALELVDMDRVGDVLSEFLSGLNDSDLEFFTEQFAGKSRFKPAGATGFLMLNRENRERHFGGDGFVDYFRWLAFAVEVNYRGFFSGSSGLQELARGLRRVEEPGEKSE